MSESEPPPAPKFYTNVPTPFFADFFRSVSNVLHAKQLGMRRPNQNPADIGELSETFIKEVLQKFFGGVLRVHRGGKIISAHRKESRQMDVLLTGQNTLAIFEDKGVYPVETVFGAIAVTSTLDLPKLRDSIRNLASIPNEQPRLALSLHHPQYIPVFAQHWRDNYPLRCVFGFDGTIDAGWVDAMTEMEKTEQIRHEDMPSLVIVNKRGHIVRGEVGMKMSSGLPSRAPFHFYDYAKMGDDYFWVSWLLLRLHDLSKLQNFVYPDYTAYFNPDMDNSAFVGFVKGEIEKMCRKAGIEPPPMP